MTLKYVTHNQYGTPQAADSWRTRLPSHAQPMSTAPSASSKPVYVYEPDGRGYLSIHHRGQWQKMKYYRDVRNESSQLRMKGEVVANPVAWSS